MLQPKTRSAVENSSDEQAPTGKRRKSAILFGVLDCLLVDEDAEFDFAGALKGEEVEAVWRWLARDVAPDLASVIAGAVDPAAEFERSLPALLAAANAEIAAAGIDPEAERRLRIKLGSAEARERLPAVLSALKCVPLIEKARGFGRAIDALPEDGNLAGALRAMMKQNGDAAAMLMMATVGEVTQPARLVIAAARSSGASEEGLINAGFAPVIEAILAHAYRALVPMRQPSGTFADIDLICRAVERFHQNICPYCRSRA